MTNTNQSIAILCHEAARSGYQGRFVIHDLADIWREWGFEVRFMYGTSDAIPADILFVHVDLSVVPEEYIEFASTYPVTINAGIRDIRKSVVSPNLISDKDAWAGPVVVKSDFNFGGAPERRVENGGRWALWRMQAKFDRLFRRLGFKGGRDEYEIYDTLSAVPESRLRNDKLVVEKFRPQLIDGLYHLQIYQFLGNHWVCTRLRSKDPIVKSRNAVTAEAIEPHEDIEQWRKSLKMDFGKLDYVVVDGEAILLDVNKTIGSTTRTLSQKMGDGAFAKNRQRLAQGIYDFI
jgi:hypothetical protein